MSDAFKDGDRVSHEKKGLGTVHASPAASDVVVSENAPAKTPDTVYVVWDDDRFPVGNVPRAELEKVPDAAAAISTGF
ncbi:hypothetical protein [Asticcacaulis sp. 201]|uniref:hypothetical protein n=1 Tax=Asticcacaulis sp. 201 TaxID=3028787 RepID=UPI00291697AB|nr:hypothetical protein [Asticcacaulis sp. 201]MDV6329338.1 hypothetical protein [Asticcacaulis sp. 201]